MIGTFNKHDFETKLHFTMKLMLLAFNGLCEFNDKNDVAATTNFYWSKALQTLWQTRKEGVIMIGIDDTIEFKAFCNFMQIGLNQMNTSIELILKSESPGINKLSQIELEMKEMAASLAEDIAQLLNEKLNEAA